MAKVRHAAQASLCCLVLACTMGRDAVAQVATESEVRQIVTFSFLPGMSDEAFAVYSDQAIPLYEKNHSMLSFRGFREVESSIPLDLIVVSAFHGMAGMDESNASLRNIAEETGTSIGAIYGHIGSLSSGHTDQFVEMMPSLGAGDPSSKRLTAFLWYRIVPGQIKQFEGLIRKTLRALEIKAEIPSSTGRFLLSDGWNYLRTLGFDSLGAYQAYRTQVRSLGKSNLLDRFTAERREVIVSSVPAMSVR